MRQITERDRLEEVVRQLRSEGWEVFVEPQSGDWPPELLDLHPDLIATREGEVLVGEVSSRHSAARERIDAIARIIPRGARFVVFWLGDVPESDPAVSAIFKYLDEAGRIFKISPSGAMLVAWAALEAAISRFASGKGLDERLRMPRQQLSGLYSLGYITEADHERLLSLWRIRSEIAHRAASIQPSRDDISFILSMARRMATNLYVSVDAMAEWFLVSYARPADVTESSRAAEAEDPYKILRAQFPGAQPRDIDLAVSLVHEQYDEQRRQQGNP